MYDLMTCEAMRSATSSRESVSGATPCAALLYEPLWVLGAAFCVSGARWWAGRAGARGPAGDGGPPLGGLHGGHEAVSQVQVLPVAINPLLGHAARAHRLVDPDGRAPHLSHLRGGHAGGDGAHGHGLPDALLLGCLLGHWGERHRGLLRAGGTRLLLEGHAARHVGAFVGLRQRRAGGKGEDR